MVRMGHSSNNASLFGPECVAWIDACGSSRRQIGRTRGRAYQRAHHARDCHRIGWRDAEQQGREPSAGGKSAGQSSTQTNQSHRCTFAQEQPDDVGRRSADSQPKTDFSLPLTDEIRENTVDTDDRKCHRDGGKGSSRNKVKRRPASDASTRAASPLIFARGSNGSSPATSCRSVGMEAMRFADMRTATVKASTGCCS